MVCSVDVRCKEGKGCADLAHGSNDLAILTFVHGSFKVQTIDTGK